MKTKKSAFYLKYKTYLIAAVCLFVFALLLVYLLVIRPAEQAIDEARQAVEGQPLETYRSTLNINSYGQEFDRTKNVARTGYANFHEICFLNGSLYVASDGGLIKITKGSVAVAGEIPEPYKNEKRESGLAGKKKTEIGGDERSYLRKYYSGVGGQGRSIKTDSDYYAEEILTIRDGLLENKIKSVKPWNSKLFIIYNDSGVALLDGGMLYNYRFKLSRYEKICAAFAGNENIIMITDTADLIEFNGESFKLLKNEVLKPKKHIVTSICRINDGVLIGTAGSGLFNYNYDKAVAENKELFESNKINSIQRFNERILISSESGVYKRQAHNDYLPVLKDYPAYCSTVREDGTVVCGTYFGEIVEVSPNGGIRNKKISQHNAPVESICYIGSLQDGNQSSEMFIVSGPDILRMNSTSSINKIKASAMVDFLSANFVTSMETDNNGRIWVGYFENGIDVLDSDLKVIVHLENDDIRVIRQLKFDASKGLMYAAASKGVMVFDSSYRYRKIDASRGLINNEVSGIELMKNGAVYCTAGGVTFDNGGLLRSIYAFHNLANNHTYCSVKDGEKIFIGTLGGVSVIHNMTVRENFSPVNSALPNNWVTSFLKDDYGDLWIGTYGGGIARIKKNGKWDNAGFPFKDIEINNNAMISFTNMLFAGTLSDGIIAYNFDTGEWRKVSKTLPSLNVTSFLQVGNKLVIGTDAGLIESDISYFK